MSKGLCTDCPKRSTCIELCPEAEAYANQDDVSFAKAFKIPGLRVDKNGIKQQVPKDREGIKHEARILWQDGYKAKEISIQLECDEALVAEAIWEIKKTSQGSLES